jgi:hypothetical protein
MEGWRRDPWVLISWGVVDGTQWLLWQSSEDVLRVPKYACEIHNRANVWGTQSSHIKSVNPRCSSLPILCYYQFSWGTVKVAYSQEICSFGEVLEAVRETLGECTFMWAVLTRRPVCFLQWIPGSWKDWDTWRRVLRRGEILWIALLMLLFNGMVREFGTSK